MRYKRNEEDLISIQEDKAVAKIRCDWFLKLGENGLLFQIRIRTSS